MSSVIMLGLMLFFIPATLIVITLNIIQNFKNKKFKKELNNLEYEKNVIDSTPIGLELSKIEAFLKNEKMEKLYTDWKKRLEEIKTKQIPKITDMILEAEYSLSQLDYKNTNYKIAKLEMEVYYVRTNSEVLLNEIKEITTSDEKNRTIITSLKTKYRELYENYASRPTDFGEIKDSVSLQFESIAHRFEDFESAMEKNEYTEVTQIIKAIDEMLKHMDLVIEEIPGIVLMTGTVLPKKVENIQNEYHEMLKRGYQLDYLNVEYNVEESNKKIEDVLGRSKVLNLEDSTFELKILNDYLDSLFNDFDKEKESKEKYEEIRDAFNKRLDRQNKIINEIFSRMAEVKSVYDLTDDHLQLLEKSKSDIEELNSDYKTLLIHTSNNAFAFSKLISEVEILSNRLSNIKETLDNTLEKIGNVKEDEARAKEQLEEIKVIMNNAKKAITKYNIPTIPQNYYTEFNEATLAIKEIVRELDNKPIDTDTLNMRVDTGRDLALKLLARANDTIKQAKMAEMAIVYGNRYRSSYEEVDKVLSYSETLFYSGEYQKSLDLTVGILSKIDSNITERIKAYLN
ncbi:MAG: septation ring formation regulator EzrA [Bacilli bacterium]|nr:septation ring formation regulator EzrA [Bacilli bacterium]